MMDQSRPTGNPFTADSTPAPRGGSLDFTAASMGLPPLLAELYTADRPPLGVFSATDLREMAKFSELPNLGGLAAHPIERPWLPEHQDADAATAMPQLPIGPARTFGRLCRTQAWLISEGCLGAAPAPEVQVRVIVPITWARLIGCLRQMLFPAAAGQSSAYDLLMWPGPLVRQSGQMRLERLHGRWPAQRTGLLIGTDDPALIARDLLAAARPIWAAQGWVIEQPAGVGDIARWLRRGTQCAPIWSRALLPAAKLVDHPAAWPALTAPGAMLFGVPVTPDGEIPPFYPPTSAESSPSPIPGWFVADPLLLPD